MKVLVFSDIHRDAAALARLMDIEADLYICAGDLADFGRGLEPHGPILARRANKLWILPGNNETESAVETFAADYGLQLFHGRTFTAGGYTFAGLGYSNPTPFHTPGEYTEDEIAARLAPFADLENLVLICHCPPYGTPLDEARPGAHFGSRSIAAFLAAHPPRVFVCGHIHEAAGREVMLGPARAINAGKRGFLLDL